MSQRDERPLVTSYDSGHEHSVEHWFEVRLLVLSEDEVTAPVEPLKMAASA
jgi:hypothetical protein